MRQDVMSHYLRERYRQEIAPALMKEIGVKSPMQVLPGEDRRNVGVAMRRRMPV
jgi:hypothetical protein